ncbi:hypothetical protein [Flavobacterium wongokense]|uniref:hypothetical protein n=1 Tax=Flavobacterium wongokense TaxID=2910674 RepID=UPI001F41D056|nr:hypothetical protein [Flavobacterium sp. WG47]MCF6131525.1 hypothetical protein [Flavobacterium sp. WG47]
MKKVFSLLALVFLLGACTPDDNPHYTFELTKIESVEIPTEFTLGQTYPITVHFKLATSCHYFNQLYYEKYLNERTIAVETAVEERNNCIETPNDEAEYTFNFYVTSNGSYKFKFYQGKDENNVDVFLEYEVPVTNKK